MRLTAPVAQLDRATDFHLCLAEGLERGERKYRDLDIERECDSGIFHIF